MKKSIIISLCLILLIMCVGYSTYFSKLNINSSSSITSNWDIEITNIEKTNTSGNVKEESSYTKDTASFSAEMEKPGDYIYYKVSVTNKGNITAIATLGDLTCTNDAFECGAYPDSSVTTSIKENSDLSDDRLIIAPNETEYYNIYLKFKDTITSMPTNLTSTLTLNLIYKQSDVGVTHKDNCYTGKVLKNGTLSITNYDEKCGTDVIIPEKIDGITVTEISNGIWTETLGSVGAFAKKGITSVIMPDTITYIGTFAFRDNAIKTLKLSENLKTINDEAFGFNQIENITFHDKLTYIGFSAFSNNGIKEINLPQNLITLGDGAFSNNKVEGENAYIYYITNGAIDKTTLNYKKKNINDMNPVSWTK